MNGDGLLTVQDVLSLIQAMLNNRFAEKGDIDGDGRVSLIDVLRVMKLVTKQS